MSPEGWPCLTYRFPTREALHDQPGGGIWQAGSGLLFYYLYQLTGEARYRDEGLRPIMTGYKRLCADPDKLEAAGQDDFAAITALGACRLYRDAALLDCVRRRVRAIRRHQDADGSCPGLDSEGVNGLTWLNWIRFVRARKLKEDLAPVRRAIARAEAFIPSLQERNPRDARAFGGLYGQTSFGIGRTLIHHRATGYGLIFLLNVEGGIEVPGYNLFGWSGEPQSVTSPRKYHRCPRTPPAAGLHAVCRTGFPPHAHAGHLPRRRDEPHRGQLPLRGQGGPVQGRLGQGA